MPIIIDASKVIKGLEGLKLALSNPSILLEKLGQDLSGSLQKHAPISSYPPNPGKMRRAVSEVGKPTRVGKNWAIGIGNAKALGWNKGLAPNLGHVLGDFLDYMKREHPKEFWVIRYFYKHPYEEREEKAQAKREAKEARQIQKQEGLFARRAEKERVVHLERAKAVSRRKVERAKAAPLRLAARKERAREYYISHRKPTVLTHEERFKRRMTPIPGVGNEIVARTKRVLNNFEKGIGVARLHGPHELRNLPPHFENLRAYLETWHNAKISLESALKRKIKDVSAEEQVVRDAYNSLRREQNKLRGKVKGLQKKFDDATKRARTTEAVGRPGERRFVDRELERTHREIVLEMKALRKEVGPTRLTKKFRETSLDESRARSQTREEKESRASEAQDQATDNIDQLETSHEKAVAPGRTERVAGKSTKESERAKVSSEKLANINARLAKMDEVIADLQARAAQADPEDTADFMERIEVAERVKEGIRRGKY